MMFSEKHEECGVFAIYNVDNAAEFVYYGLHSLQHRGQEGCGIVASDGENLHRIKGEGLVTEVFTQENLQGLPGNQAIGHVRYSTMGGGGIDNVQPFLFHHFTGDFAMAHNGNIVNAFEIRRFLETKGSIFQSTSDSEILAHLIKKTTNNDNRITAICDALNMLEGAFAFLIMTKDKVYACRDKYGLRPLSIGKLNGGYVISSETCAFSTIGASFVRDIAPGEVVCLHEGQIYSYDYSKFKHHHMCAMEYVYFSRPDSDIEGCNVHAFRKESGKILARKMPVDADMVVGVPDSSLSSAMGYAEEANIPYEMGLIKNKYIGRTFIQPSQSLREKGVKLKLSPVESIVKGKKIILVDDSVVRGTTSKRIVAMLRFAGAKEVHLRVSSPQIIAPCYYGVDMSTYEELISAAMSLEKIKEYLDVDSICFLSTDDLFQASKRSSLCIACFTENYPTNIYKYHKKEVKEDE